MNLIAGSFTDENPSTQFSNTDDNFDVTIVVVNGELKITPVEVTVTITGNSDSKVYNGEAQTSETEVTPSCEDELFDTSKFSYTGATTITKTDVGNYSEDIDITKASYDDANLNVTFEAGTPVTFNITKKPITITKKSLLGDEPLAGTQIQVYDEEGHVIFDQITGEDGTIPEFFALYGRSYTFKEIYAPNGFAIFTHVLSFSVTEDGEVEGVTELKDDYVRLKLLKVDEEGNPLTGVEFTLFDKEELPIQVRVTGEDGTVEFTQIPYGDYVVVETKPAEGMALADFKKELHVDGTWDNDTIEIIKVVNHPEEKTGEPVPFTMWAIFIILLCGAFGWGTATLANKYCTKEYVMTEEALFGEKRS